MNDVTALVDDLYRIELPIKSLNFGFNIQFTDNYLTSLNQSKLKTENI